MIEIFSNFVPFQNIWTLNQIIPTCTENKTLKSFFNIKLSFEFDKNAEKKVGVQNTSAAKLYWLYGTVRAKS